MLNEVNLENRETDKALEAYAISLGNPDTRDNVNHTDFTNGI